MGLPSSYDHLHFHSPRYEYTTDGMYFYPNRQAIVSGHCDTGTNPEMCRPILRHTHLRNIIPAITIVSAYSAHAPP